MPQKEHLIAQIHGAHAAHEFNTTYVFPGTREESLVMLAKPFLANPPNSIKPDGCHRLVPVVIRMRAMTEVIKLRPLRAIHIRKH